MKIVALVMGMLFLTAPALSDTDPIPVIFDTDIGSDIDDTNV